MVALVEKIFKIAQDLRTDPFAIRRILPATVDVTKMSPIFDKHEIVRENLTAKAIIGYGQVSALDRYY